MLANQRKQLILERLNMRHAVTVSELVEEFNVSTETVRRDLEAMEKENLLSRVHGGAISIKRMKNFENISIRVATNMDLKKQLSETALNYVHDGDVIAIDSGSTASAFALALKERQYKSLSVITYSSEVFSILSECYDYKVTISGGDYLPGERVFCGFLANEAMRKLYYPKAFVFPSALSLEDGAHDFIPEVYENQLVLINHANEVYFLADSTKFETTGNLKLCDLLPEYRIITDKQLPDSIYNSYKEKNVNIIR